MLSLSFARSRRAIAEVIVTLGSVASIGIELSCDNIGDCDERTLSQSDKSRDDLSESFDIYQIAREGSFEEMGAGVALVAAIDEIGHRAKIRTLQLPRWWSYVETLTPSSHPDRTVPPWFLGFDSYQSDRSTGNVLWGNDPPTSIIGRMTNARPRLLLTVERNIGRFIFAESIVVKSVKISV
jgi:hypothetical protein